MPEQVNLKKKFHNTSCSDKLCFDNDHAAGFYLNAPLSSELPDL